MPRPPKDTVLSKQEIGARIRAVRTARELTQAQLAEALGTSHTNISDIERGTRGVTVQQIARLARTLGVSSAQILDSSPKAAKNGHRPLPRRFELIQTLPRARRRVLFEIIDAFLEKHQA